MLKTPGYSLENKLFSRMAKMPKWMSLPGRVANFFHCIHIIGALLFKNSNVYSAETMGKDINLNSATKKQTLQPS